jgi:tetratricopeptide (TPR) repeat protein
MQSSTIVDEIEIIKTADFMKSETLALANALYHEGRMTEAVDLLSAHIERARDDERLAAAYLLAITYNGVNNHIEALQLLTAHYPLADRSRDHQLLAHFMEAYGATYQLIAKRENFEVNADRALIQYAAASHHYEQAGCPAVAGCTENNIGIIHGTLGRFTEARRHFEDARRFLRDSPVKTAQVDISEAQMCFSEGNKEFEAYRLAARAMAVFTEHEETRLIIEATPTLQKASADYMAARRERQDQPCTK